jgi:metal-sulfur cluster biosynthetic enzyme
MSASAVVPAIETRLRELLGTVQDPCSVGIGSPVDIVDLGLVEEVQVSEEGDVMVRLVLTQPTCFYFFDLRTHIIDTLSADPAVRGVEVEIVKEPWTPDRMSDEHRQRVRARRAAALAEHRA